MHKMENEGNKKAIYKLIEKKYFKKICFTNLYLYYENNTDFICKWKLNKCHAMKTRSPLRGEPALEGKKINFLKVVSLLTQNEFYEEVEGLMYGAGIAD